MKRSVVPAFLPRCLQLSLLFLAACTAWQYDIESCDPNARDLSKDVCNTLNPRSLGCMIYQCDGQTSQCKESPRDFDRDGDPDASCGGTDCNDYDPSVYGRQGKCSCTSEIVGTPCSVGQKGSACERKTNYACINNTLACLTTPGTPMDYGSGPDPVNGSWDWNCDGQVEPACSWMDPTGRYYRTSCPPTTCSDAQRMQIAMDQSGTLCGNYCAALAKDACDAPTSKPAILNCDPQPTCGSRIGVCFCRWDIAWSHPLGTCLAETYSTIGSIYCR